MRYPRTDIVNPLGLVTQKNQYGQYPNGALRTCRNFVARNPGELLQAPDTQNLINWTANDHTLQKLFPLDLSHTYSFSNTGTTWLIRESGSATAVPALFTATSLFSATGRISPVRARERMIVNTLKGALVVDSMAPANLAERTFRQAGLPQPHWVRTSTFPNTTTTDAGALSANTMVGYAVCFARKLADGYVIRSTPTPILKVNVVVLSNFRQIVMWNQNDGLIAGDIIEVYRTDGLNTLGSGNPMVLLDPGQTLKRTQSYVLTSADIATGSVTLVDTVSYELGTRITPGTELYINPFQEGPDFSNDQPPIAACVAKFKGYTFYARTTERPIWEFGCPGGIGAEVAAVAQGLTSTYHRAYSLGQHGNVNGTSTTGLATITGVAAASFIGLDVGQQINTAGGTLWPNGTAILSLNSGTGVITMNQNAISGAATGWTFDEVIEINGTVFRYIDLTQLIHALGQDVGNTLVTATDQAKWEIAVDSAVPYVVQFAFLTNPTVVILPGRTVYAPSSFTVRGSNGGRYSPPIPTMTQTAQTISAVVRKNRICWSKFQEPEHCPSALETFAGFDEIIALNATRDALWIWCTDGLRRMSGDGGADGLGFRIDDVDTTLILSAPQASTVFDEVLFGYTNVGFVSVDSAGNKTNLSDTVVGNLLPGTKYVETRSIICAANETDSEILLGLGEDVNGSSDRIFIYNVVTKIWSDLAQNGASLSNITAMAMMRDPSAGEPRLLFGVSPLGGGNPSYSEWNSAAAFLTASLEYQPVMGDGPLTLCQFSWADYLFAVATANGKQIVPTWNGVTHGVATVVDMQNAGYGRGGCPRAASRAHSVVPGFQSLSGTPQSRFQGLSLAMSGKSNKGKKR